MINRQKALTKVFGDPQTRILKRLQKKVDVINTLSGKYKKMTKQELQGQTAILKKKFEKGTSLDDLLPDAFALVREASERVLKMRHFDVQLIGGMVLHEGNV